MCLDVGLTGAVSNHSCSLWMREMGSIILCAVDRQGRQTDATRLGTEPRLQHVPQSTFV